MCVNLGYRQYIQLLQIHTPDVLLALWVNSETFRGMRGGAYMGLSIHSV